MSRRSASSEFLSGGVRYATHGLRNIRAVLGETVALVDDTRRLRAEMRRVHPRLED